MPMLSDVRSSHGLRITVSWLRAWLLPSRGDDPVTLSTYSTSGSPMRYSVARSVTRRVRSSVAPSGSSSSTVK